MPDTELAEVLDGRRRWTVVHGDCLDVMRTLPDKCCVIATDVPYQVGKPGVENDDLPWDEYLPWLDERLAECCRVAKRVFTTFATTKLIRFIRETTVPPTYPLHWHKPFLLNRRTKNGSPFLSCGEAILYWGPKSCKAGGKRGYDSFSYNAMWIKDRKELGIEAPTPKPEPLMYAALEFWADRDPPDLILDPWCGSGTTLVAAYRWGLPCIGIDIDLARYEETIGRMRAEERHTRLGDDKRGQGALFDV